MQQKCKYFYICVVNRDYMHHNLDTYIQINT